MNKNVALSRIFTQLRAAAAATRQVGQADGAAKHARYHIVRAMGLVERLSEGQPPHLVQRDALLADIVRDLEAMEAAGLPRKHAITVNNLLQRIESTIAGASDRTPIHARRP